MQTEARKKSLYVADSKRWLREGIPHPRYFRERGCKLLKTKKECCKERPKRLQEYGNKRVGANDRREFFAITQQRVPQLWTYVNSKLVS